MSRACHAVAALALCVGGFGACAAGVTSPAYFAQRIRPVLKQYCYPCHSSEKHKGDFDMESFATVAQVKGHPKIWQTVIEQLANDEMPPAQKPQPSREQKQQISTWARALLDEWGREHAGDPGPVVIRRLSNAEYTYTIQDLTRIASLEPAREFPVDGAAGEGFMNTGQALVISPSLLTKYLDAGKEVASHLVLLPEGVRFSAGTTRRDWTEEIVAEIRKFYAQFTDTSGGEKVNLQGIIFETNEGGRLPLERYLAATLAERTALMAGRKTGAQVAREHGVNAKYLEALWKVLTASKPSPLLDPVRARWRTARSGDAPALAAEIAQGQKALWKFNSVGHLGKAGGPKSWMEPINPLAAQQELRLKLPVAKDAKEVTLYLVVSDAGDGAEDDFAVWKQPRLVAPGRPDLMLRDVRDFMWSLARRRTEVFAQTAECLAAAFEAESSAPRMGLAELARRHGVEPETLGAWLDYLGIGAGGTAEIASHFTNRLTQVSKYDFVNGWGSPETPSLVANSSDQAVRIPGNLRPHSVAVHPSPTLQAAVGWRSPEAAVVRIEATIIHAHPECGNGVTWSLEFRRGAIRKRLASGATQGGKEVKAGPFENVSVQPGDLVSVLIGPRDGNHACDLTAVDLALTSGGENPRSWSLGADVSPDVLAANPHADRFGHEGVWHFYTEPERGGAEPSPVIPPGSTLARWQSATNQAEKTRLAKSVQTLLCAGSPMSLQEADAKLYQQLEAIGGPLFRANWRAKESSSPVTETNGPMWGLEPALFGRSAEAGLAKVRLAVPRERAPLSPSAARQERRALPDEDPADGVDPASLGVKAPAIIEVHLPADLAAGCEFVTTGILDPARGAEGSVQFEVLTNRPERESGLLSTSVQETEANGVWTSYNRKVSYGVPIVVNEGTRARQRLEAQCDEFRRWFPAALCYAKIVPVDEVITLILFHREDEPLVRLMLDEAGKAKLDRLWDELRYVSQDAFTMVDAFEQLWQYATQDADPKVFEPLRKPIQERAAALRQRLRDTEPRHLEALAQLARRAYRRPLAGEERAELEGLYHKLRQQGLPHEEAIRLTLARILVAPAFLYRAETPGPGTQPAPLNDWELASRLSYFLWSSLPDDELAATAAAGKLHEPKILAAQARRMLRDDRVRRLAIEFGCQWLHVHDFDTLDEKSERHFPTFTALRGDMYEETIRFFTALFQSNAPLTEVLDADYTFLNQKLAAHYGIPGIAGDGWQRVEGIKNFSRGGILAQASTLAKQSGASRTSPILRGNWVAEALLGDILPRPPKDVPRLPEEEGTDNLTVRQMIEKHSSDPRCYRCHERIDAFGFALEGFDAIGRQREHDLGGHPVDTHAKVKDGTELDGLEGLRQYLLTKRRADFERQFCKKLLGYALGRSVQLSDEPLLRKLSALKGKDCRIGAIIEMIVRSPQFREIRGKEVGEMVAK